MKVLLVEDDEVITKELAVYFSRKGAEVDAVQDGESALALIGSGMLEAYDVILLDVDLPESHDEGFTICREIRENSDIPLIFITGRNGIDDMLHGYALGCDDYISKPPLLSILFEKCIALKKRATGTVRKDTLECGAIRLEGRSLSCFVNGTEITLTSKELAILRYFMENPNRLLSRDQFLSRLWDESAEVSDRVIDNHVKLLRKKLGKAGKQIVTVRGQGYKLTDGKH